jgi:hypothetical protein
VDAEDLLSAVESGSYSDPGNAMGALAEAVAAINREMLGEPDGKRIRRLVTRLQKGRRIGRGTVRRVRVLDLGRTPSRGERQRGVGASVASSSARARGSSQHTRPAEGVDRRSRQTPALDAKR